MGAVESAPYIVSWNVTKRCNLICPHCYLNAGGSAEHAIGPPEQRQASELTRDEARLVIDELSYLNNRLMLVLSGGEPMLREDIFDIVKYASDAGFITVMGSNGTLFTRENLRRLKDAGLKGIGISIDSSSAEKHDRFRGLQGAWDLSVKALKDAREVGIETQLDATLTDENVEELDDMVELSAKLGAKAVNFFFLVCTGRAMRTSISTENYDSALKRIAKKFTTETRLMVRARCAPHIYRVLYQSGFSLPGGSRGCLAGRSYMRITAEGDITPCPYMPVVVGNIRETSLGTIWEESPELKMLRGGELRGRCGICEFANLCGGCRARGLAEHGDFMEEDTLCSYAPEGEPKVELEGLFSTSLAWDDEAKERIRKVPPFIRGMIVNAAEGMARKRGMEVVTSELIDELKKMRHSRTQ